MRMQLARSSSRSPSARAFAGAIQVAAGFFLGALGGVGLLAGALLVLLHDHDEVQGLPLFQLSRAATRLQEAAQFAGGVFPESGYEALRELAPIPADRLDPWGAPFRYERLGDGRRARIFTLGEDGKPGGGEDCDADIVVWFDATDAHTTWDARVAPEAWR
jgi:hypothetical protein